MANTIHKTPGQVKRLLGARGIRYGTVAAHAGRSWDLVFSVINGRRRSARILASLSSLLGEPIAGIRPRRKA